MPTTIILKKGTGTPLTTDLEVAELAVDTTGGGLWTKLANGIVTQLNDFGSIAADNYQYWQYKIDGFSTTSVMSTTYVDFQSGTNMTITKEGYGPKVSLNDSITLSGSVSAVGNISTDSSITAAQNISATGSLSGGTLTVSGNGAITGNLQVSGTLTDVNGDPIGGGTVDLTGYATETWVSTNYQPAGSYLTSADLSGYATETWVSTNYQPAGSYLTSESDPTVPSHVKNITTTDITNWNNKGTSNFNGDYNSLSNKPFIPTHTSHLSNDSGYITSSALSGYATQTWVNQQGFAKGSFVPTSGNTTISGTLTATDFVATSDERLKENITTAPSDVISKLRGVEFTWKDSGDKASGVIAQELEAAGLDHLVHNDGDRKSVAYNGLIAYLIEEVKALRAEVESLKK